ncbi:Uncharacterized protein dnm_020140 [Desulfonema magnum]|uniref:Uncharacterized protein n=1 Tax=Desulfonema magnum TaxID=45655 RepID=A0A975BID9_9BACT|nr:Uncharacterized protein dnm_020140 [Desulfonema magnum]
MVTGYHLIFSYQLNIFHKKTKFRKSDVLKIHEIVCHSITKFSDRIRSDLAGQPAIILSFLRKQESVFCMVPGLWIPAFAGMTKKNLII